MTHYFPCPSCQSELEVYVNRRDKETDAPDECDECGYVLTSQQRDAILDEAIEDDSGAEIDYAMDYLRDR